MKPASPFAFPPYNRPVARTVVTLEQVKERIARRLSDYKVPPGPGQIGGVSITLARAVTRTFKAHWTGFKISFARSTVVLHAPLSDGRFWAEGYVSTSQPSWVLAFRKEPPPARGSGGPRPDDEVASPEAVEISLAQRQKLIERGIVREEELIRMEDYDDPLEAVDAFFNFTALYILKAVGAAWSQLGYQADPSVGWDETARDTASLPIDAAIEEGLRRSDILWLTPDTVLDGKPIPCWYVFTKEGRLFVLSGEPQQIIPDAARVRGAHVVTRWKGRDARLAEFAASVRALTATDPEFNEVGHLLITKRQSVRGSAEETLERWRRQCVILELTPRV